MEPFASLAELQARCDWTFDDDEERVALGYLEEATDLARAYGRFDWTAAIVPRMVKNIVISAVRRYMRNPEGYTTSRAGDETVAWQEQGDVAASIFFSKSEIKLIRSLAGTTGLRSAQATAWGPVRKGPEAYTVPVSGWPGEEPFPYFSDPTEPW